MHFDTKSYLKSTRNHTVNHTKKTIKKITKEAAYASLIRWHSVGIYINYKIYS